MFIQNVSLFLQKANLELAFKTGESVGISATLVRHFCSSCSTQICVFYTNSSTLTLLFFICFLKLHVYPVWQTVEEMLKAEGPDWQRVLGYVESIFRHFEM